LLIKTGEPKNRQKVHQFEKLGVI